MMRCLRLIFAALMLWLIPASGLGQSLSDGIRSESEHFVLTSEAPLDGRALLSDLEAFRLAVAADLGLPEVRQEPLRLNLIGDPDMFGALAPVGAAGIYQQSAVSNDVIIAFDPRPGQPLSMALELDWLRLILRHETVHHLIRTRYPRKLPIWLEEGLAEYYASYQRGPDGGAQFGRALPGQEVPSPTQDWLPLRTVIESLSHYPDFGPTGQTPTRAHRLYYGQSWALANFIMAQPDGLTQVHQFLDGWSRGGDSEDSFERAFGLSYAPLEAALRRRAADAQPAQPDALGPPTHIVVETTRADRTMLLRNRLRLLMTHGQAGAGGRIGALDAQLGSAADTLDLDLARSLYGWRIKNWSASLTAADSALAKHPGNARALKMRAKATFGRLSERQDLAPLWDAAEIAALQALAVRPDDPELHLFHVATSMPTDIRMTPNVRVSLDWLQTHRIHLRLPHASMLTIPALIYEDRLDQADAVINSAARWASEAADIVEVKRRRSQVAAKRAGAR
ncbi:MAG: hypothetical protein AAF926_01145 [Pseudomonadota bacterium]